MLNKQLKTSWSLGYKSYNHGFTEEATSRLEEMVETWKVPASHPQAMAEVSLG